MRRPLVTLRRAAPAHQFTAQVTTARQAAHCWRWCPAPATDRPWPHARRAAFQATHRKAKQPLTVDGGAQRQEEIDCGLIAAAIFSSLRGGSRHLATNMNPGTHIQPQQRCHGPPCQPAVSNVPPHTCMAAGSAATELPVPNASSSEAANCRATASGERPVIAHSSRGSNAKAKSERPARTVATHRPSAANVPEGGRWRGRCRREGSTGRSTASAYGTSWRQARPPSRLNGEDAHAQLPLNCPQLPLNWPLTLKVPETSRPLHTTPTQGGGLWPPHTAQQPHAATP